VPRRRAIRTALTGLAGLAAPRLLGIAPAWAAGNPEGLAAAFPAPAKVVQTTAANLAKAYASAAPGTTILVAPGGTLSGGLTLGRSGTASAPIVVRVGTWNGTQVVDPTRFPAATITGTVTVSGSYNWLRGFTLGGGSVSAGATGNRFNRCAFTLSGGIVDAGTSTSVDWCEIGRVPGVLLLHKSYIGCRTPFTYRTWLHDGVNSPTNCDTMEMMGATPKDYNIPLNGQTLECLFSSPGDLSEAWENKSTGNRMIRCAMHGASTRSLRTITRQGTNSVIQGLYAAEYSFVGLRGSGHVLADCVYAGSAPPAKGWGVFSGNISWDDWVSLLQAGASTASQYPAGKNVRHVRIDAPVLGMDPSGGATVKAVGTTLEACTGTVADNGVPYTTLASSDYPALTVGGVAKAARDWPTPTGTAADRLGPNGVYDPND
jgi:hypothetical protein